MTMFSLQDKPLVTSSKTPDRGQLADTTEDGAGVARLIGEGDPVKENGKVVEIQLKGPMSHAYTEILMMLLGKKEGGPNGMRMESVQQTLYLNDMQSEEQEADRSIVYVYDGKTMNLGDLVGISDAIVDGSKGVDKKRVFGVIENATDFVERHPGNTMLDQTLRMARNYGSDIYFNKSTWLKSIGF